MEKVRSAYNCIRNDPDLARLLTSMAKKAEEDAAAVSQFAQRARDYAESVEASPDNLTGRCDECPQEPS